MLEGKGKGRKLAWQGDGHETQKVAQRRSLLGDAEGHVQREAEQCRLRQLSHTLNEMVAHVTGIPRRGLNPQTACEPARGKNVKKVDSVKFSKLIS